MSAVGFEHISIPLIENKKGSADGMVEYVSSLSRRIRRMVEGAYFFIFEKSLREQQHVDLEVVDTITSYAPEVVIVSDIWAALGVPSVFMRNWKVCLVLLNDEVAFHRELLFPRSISPTGRIVSTGRLIWRLARSLAQYRFKKRFEATVGRCRAIVTLTGNDIPRSAPAGVHVAVLPPLLSERSMLWSYTSSRSVLFVGHIDYFANRLAIGWICTKFAPALRMLDEAITISIIGATDSCVPDLWREHNVRFLGASSDDEVMDHLLRDNLFIAPIENAFGAKLKLAECASYATPFVATDAALSGLPFLTGVPRIVLDDYPNAALTVKKLLDDVSSLRALSGYIRDQMRDARKRQSSEWMDFIASILRPSDAGDQL
ncbi:glycosyltransferase [Steroidobacter sp. S1-65]|uniref:Glycosyltransferase n=1 Tax=Steroidobacter gossypii TaxID=2805490 RepID=A0ABS1X6Q2_9GAMM|nr:glycosyltransferase [Steroidobacter gossypii]MBM0108906.1 glycosyltransferase [Steroidobacter gossypii]